MPVAHLNAIGTAVPRHEVHGKFVAYAPRLLRCPRQRRLFARMAERAGIEARYSVLAPHPDPERLDRDGFYRAGAFPGTAARMQAYERHAADLAFAATLDLDAALAGVSHLVVATCTGFFAPGLDLQLIERLSLDHAVERTVVGFMGCSAAINALKVARHIVRSEPVARVLVVCLELCTLHLQETDALEQVLSFLIFADGCAAGLVSAEPQGLALHDFRVAVMPEAADQITWRIGDAGFDMRLSGEVPGAIGRGLAAHLPALLAGRAPEAVALWAIHPGGRSVLDAIERSLQLPEERLRSSRDVLRRYGNMSSATVMFVLKAMLQDDARGPGCAMAFGPGLVAETMLFEA
ncbi:MAG: type III polyketide synthase [Geminicoccaceae bacterium]